MAVFSGYLNFNPKPFLLCVLVYIWNEFSQPKRDTVLCATNNPFETQIYSSSWVKLLKKQCYRLSWVILHTLWPVSSFIRKGKVPHDFIVTLRSLLLYSCTMAQWNILVIKAALFLVNDEITMKTRPNFAHVPNDNSFIAYKSPLSCSLISSL